MSDELGPAAGAVSPYATGGGGVRFEHRVGAVFLAKLLGGMPVSELDERPPTEVAFQQSPDTTVDDLVITAGAPDGTSSVRLEIAIRRAPKFVASDTSTLDLVEALVRADLAAESNTDNSVDRRLAVCVSGRQAHAGEVARLATLARGQADADAFARLVGTPRRFSTGIRRRLGQLTTLVQAALNRIGTDRNDSSTSRTAAAHQTWSLLQRLWVLQLDLEMENEADWTRLAQELRPVALGHTVEAAKDLRQRLVDESGELDIQAGVVDVALLRRRLHGTLDPVAGPGPSEGWKRMLALDAQARASVQGSIAPGRPDELTLPRPSVASALHDAIAANTDEVLVVGDSGTGKSAALMSLIEPDHLPTDVQAVAVNLPDLPTVSLDLLTSLGPADQLFTHMSAPHRWLVIDAAEAAVEKHRAAFAFLLSAARTDQVRVIAVSTTDGADAVEGLLNTDGRVPATVTVPGLDDDEMGAIKARFPHLSRLVDDSRSRELLRRPLVLDLLRSASNTELLVSESQAFEVIWQHFVRNDGHHEHGLPDVRENAVLLLANHALGLKTADQVMSSIDFGAVEGLRRSTFLRPASGLAWERVPAFRHDLLRTYAVARLLLSERDPAAAIEAAGAPRIFLPAARLACEVLLSAPDTPEYPVAGRFAWIQEGFETVASSDTKRWADVPSEALLQMHAPALVLADAWPGLSSGSGEGVGRLLRVLSVRHQHGLMLDATSAEPIIAQTLVGGTPASHRAEVDRVTTEWLRSHVLASTPSGHPVRTRVRDATVETCRRRAGLATPTDPWDGDQLPPPYEWIGESEIEHLAMLGDDINEDVEILLRRVAEEEPESIAPAVETLFAGHSLAGRSPALLASLTESYYIEHPAEVDGWDISGLHDEGIRDHTYADRLPMAHWMRGPFLALLRADYGLGVRVLNTILDHAARGRVRILAHFDDGESHERVLALTGTERSYVGDQQVWPWYRGTGNGPNPCMSALQALELVTEERIQNGEDPQDLTSLMLEDANNLAMPALALAVLVRHLESAAEALDPFVVEPDVWGLESSRVVLERPPFAASFPNLLRQDRREWSMMETAAALATLADEERADVLRNLAARLVEKEQTRLAGQESGAVQERLATVRNWARALDREALQFTKLGGGRVQIQQIPDPEIEAILNPSRTALDRVNDAIGLEVRHGHPRENGAPAPAIDAATLASDIALARQVAAAPEGDFGLTYSGPAAVAATALELNLISRVDVSVDDLEWSARTLFKASQEGDLGDREDGTSFTEAADRSAARALPLLLLPVAHELRTALFGEGAGVIDRVVEVSRGVAVGGANESRLAYARGLDHVWAAPCETDLLRGRCHHRVALDVVTESYIRCRVGSWDEHTGGRSVLALDPPRSSSLDELTGNEISASRLVAAMRGTGAAAITGICCAPEAASDLRSLLSAFDRVTVAHDRGFYRSEGDALVAARAALWQARAGDDEPVLKHVRNLVQSPRALSQALRALSSAAEERREAGLHLRRLWPHIIDLVLDASASNPKLFSPHPAGDYSESLLIPTTTQAWNYWTQERTEEPFAWRDLISWAQQVERWVASHPRSPKSIDQLVMALAELDVAHQLKPGMDWVERVASSVGPRCSSSYMLPAWLKERRFDVAGTAQQQVWQRIVDHLLVEGDQRVAELAD